MKKNYKRFCKYIRLKDDPMLIEEYKKLHKAGWPEITEGMKQVGIIDMEIYIAGTNLFMIMDAKADFDHEKAMAQLAKLPKQAEWETLVSKYQAAKPNASAGEKWQILERIYKKDQKHECKPEDGYVEQIDV
jgi:L-rhamnose mutarotase